MCVGVCVCVCVCLCDCVCLFVHVCVCVCVCVLQRMPASISPLMKCSFSFCRKGKFISLAFSHHHFCFNFL